MVGFPHDRPVKEAGFVDCFGDAFFAGHLVTPDSNGWFLDSGTTPVAISNATDGNLLLSTSQKRPRARLKTSAFCRCSLAVIKSLRVRRLLRKLTNPHLPDG